MAPESPPFLAEADDGGFSVLYHGIALYSRVNPRSAPERVASEFSFHPDTLYVISSPLLGYGLEIFLSRIPLSCAVLALELDPALAALSSERLPRSLLDNPRFRFLSNAADCPRAIHDLGRFRRCVEISLSYGRRLHPKAYDRAKASLDAELSRYWRNRMTMIHMGRLWLRNLLRNLGRLMDADVRQALPWEVPVVVCGAGPSLDAALPWIERERHRIRLVVCDTAVGALSSRGIKPDAVVCLEGQIHNLKDFLPASGRRFPLFLDLTTHPSSFRAIRGPKILTLTRFDELTFLDRLEALRLPILPVPPLGSVGVLAVHLAQTLTSGPILLTGLDFSFRPGATHAKGSPALTTEGIRENRLYKARSLWNASYAETPCSSSKEERSNALLSSYADTCASEIQGDSRVFDLRPSGIFLGRPRLDFEEASRLLDTSLSDSVSLSAAPAFAPVDRDAMRSGAAAFLGDERSRLERLLDGLRSRSADLPELASDCAWIYSWFPDEHRVLELSGDVRNRLLAEALDWRRRIDEARSALEEP